jgi:hypothetical protein
MKIKKKTKLSKKALVLDGKLEEYLLNFFKTSKPYDFCSLSSPSIRNRKIEDFFNYLKVCQVYGAFIDKKLIGVIFITEREDFLYLEFVFGQPQKCSNTEMFDSFYETLIWVLDKYNKKKIIAEIRRVHKKEKFIKYIKRIDKVCNLKEDPNNIELTEISWEYDRLVEHLRDKSNN